MNTGSITTGLLIFFLLFFAPELSAQNCRITNGVLDFGDISNVETLEMTVTGTLDVRCNPRGSPGVSLRVCVSLDTGSGGNTQFDRRLSGRFGSELQFQMYRDPARLSVWADNDNAIAVDFPPLQPGNNVISVNYYGVIFGGQVPAASGRFDSDFAPVVAFETNSTVPCTAINGNALKGKLSATARVGGFCNITARDLVFPTVASLDSPVEGTSELTFVCPTSLPYSISLDGGSVSANINDRRMAFQGSGPEQVSYQLFQDATHTVIWGDGTTGSSYDSSGAGAVETRTVYGLIPSQPRPGAGVYLDQITVTISF